MFLIRVVLSHITGLDEIILIALDIPEAPNQIIYEGKKYYFEKYLMKTGKPLYKEFDVEEY